MRNFSEVKICNCSECGEEIRTVWVNGRRIGDGPTRRMNGRPLCESCEYVPVPKSCSRGVKDDEASPWQEVAIRHMEDSQ